MTGQPIKSVYESVGDDAQPPPIAAASLPQAPKRARRKRGAQFGNSNAVKNGLRADFPGSTFP